MIDSAIITKNVPITAGELDKIENISGRTDIAKVIVINEMTIAVHFKGEVGTQSVTKFKNPVYVKISTQRVL